MTQISYPYTLEEDAVASAAEVQAMFDAIKALTPWADAYLGGMSAAKLTHPAGFVYPASTIPSSVYSNNGGGGGGGGGALSLLSSDPAFIRAYGLQFTRRAPVSAWTAPSGGGFVAPIKDGVLMCSRTNDRVYEMPRNSAGGGDSLFVSQQTHTFTSGDKPVHAVAKDQSTAYVLCQGNSPSVNPSIKTINLGVAGGAASAFVDLGATYTSARMMETNRDGSYLYVLAKRSGDTVHRRLLRIDTATLAVSECALTNTTGEYHGLCVIYNDASVSNSTGNVIIGCQSGAYSEPEVFTVKEANGNVYAGSFPSTPDAYVIQSGSSSGSGPNLYGLIAYRGGFATIVYKSSTTVTEIEAYQYTGSLLSVSGICSYTLAVVPIKGGACTDGRLVYVPLAAVGGTFVIGDPFASAAATSGYAPTGASALSVAPVDYCGAAFSGQHFIGTLYDATTPGARLFSI